MSAVQLMINNGSLQLLGGDDAMLKVVEDYSPIERAFRLVFEDLYRYPDGTRLDVHGSVRGEHILWGRVEVALKHHQIARTAV